MLSNSSAKTQSEIRCIVGLAKLSNFWICYRGQCPFFKTYFLLDLSILCSLKYNEFCIEILHTNRVTRYLHLGF